MVRWSVAVKPWADGRLRFFQVRRAGRVVWGVVYDASDSVLLALTVDVVLLVATRLGVDVSGVEV